MTQAAPIPFPDPSGLTQPVAATEGDGLPLPAKVARAVPVTPERAKMWVSRLPLAVPGGGVLSPAEDKR